MTDKEFIDKYILEGWKFDTELPTTSGSNMLFGISSHDESMTFTINDFIKDRTNYYGDWYCEKEEKYLGEIIKDWFNSQKDEIIADLKSRLTGLKVVLGPRNWQCVDQEGNIFFWKQLVLEFKDKYSKRLIKTVYDDWYQDMVFETSEKMMNEPWS